MWDIIVNCTQPWLRDKFHILSDNEINVTYWARDTTVKNHVHPVPVTHYSGRGRPAVMKRTAYVIDTIALHCGADEALSRRSPDSTLTWYWRRWGYCDRVVSSMSSIQQHKGRHFNLISRLKACDSHHIINNCACT